MNGVGALSPPPMKTGTSPFLLWVDVLTRERFKVGLRLRTFAGGCGNLSRRISIIVIVLDTDARVLGHFPTARPTIAGLIVGIGVGPGGVNLVNHTLLDKGTL